MSGDPLLTLRGVVLEGGGHLRVRWGDGHESLLPLSALRRSCPCARCRVNRARGGLPIVSGGSAGTLGALEIAPVGHYALRIRWSDDHKSGIYPYSLLRSLCECESCRLGVGRG